jgi:hypothetical protein
MVGAALRKPSVAAMGRLIGLRVALRHRDKAIRTCRQIRPRRRRGHSASQHAEAVRAR